MKRGARLANGLFPVLVEKASGNETSSKQGHKEANCASGKLALLIEQINQQKNLSQPWRMGRWKQRGDSLQIFIRQCADRVRLLPSQIEILFPLVAEIRKYIQTNPAHQSSKFQIYTMWDLEGSENSSPQESGRCRRGSENSPLIRGGGGVIVMNNPPHPPHVTGGG